MRHYAFCKFHAKAKIVDFDKKSAVLSKRKSD